MRPNISITRNAVFAVIQVVVTGGVLFFLYRYLLKAIGSEQVGVWAIVLAAASASRISEMGFSGSAVKFTAKYIARGETNKATEVVQTTCVTIGVVLICILVGGYPLIAWIVGKLISGSQTTIALKVLPIALFSVWIGAISGVFLAGLDGCQRIDVRAIITIFGNLFLLWLTWMLVPRYGLIGLAWAQIGQGALMLSAGRILLQRGLPFSSWLPVGWRYSRFREMFVYGVNFQINSIFAMLFEPTTKALMAIFGGLTATAYYEMAHRMVVQFRSLLVSANQVIVPKIAALQEKEPKKIQEIYIETYRILFFVGLPLFTGVAAITPLVSELWIGHYEPKFVSFGLIVSAGWWLNTYNAPAYFVNLGTGLLFWNTIGHVAIGILNIILGYFFGLVFGGVGVALGYALALIIGSGIIVIKYHLNNQIPFRTLLPGESRTLLVSCFLGLLLGWLVFQNISIFDTNLKKAFWSAAIFIIVITPALWLHPIRKKLIHRELM